MGKNSEFQRNKHFEQIAKFNDLKTRLPKYTYAYLDDKRRSSQISTAIQYCYDLLSFYEYFGTNIDIKSLTYNDINNYQDYLESGDIRKNSNSSIKRKMAALHGLFLYGINHNMIEFDPIAGASIRKKKKESAIVYMTIEEVNNLIKTIDKCSIGTSTQQKHLNHYRFRDVAILTLFLNTGIRVSECVGLDIDDLNFKDNYLIVVRKGGKEQRVFFNEQVSIALQDYLEFERYIYSIDDEKALFLSNRKKRMSIPGMQKVVTKYTSAIIPDKHITAHKLRSTYGTNLYRTTQDIRLTADVLGHTDINTTAKYYASQSDENRKRAGQINLYDKEK